MISRLSGSSETIHLGQGQREHAEPADDTVLRDVRPARFTTMAGSPRYCRGWVLLNGTLAIVRLTRRDRPKASAKLMAWVLKGERWTPRSAMMPDVR